VAPDGVSEVRNGGHAYEIPARRCYENAAIDPAYGSSNVSIFDLEVCYTTAGPPPGTTSGWWPGTLFGIDTIVLLVVVSAVALFVILAVWRSRRRRSEQETEREELDTGRG